MYYVNSEGIDFIQLQTELVTDIKNMDDIFITFMEPNVNPSMLKILNELKIKADNFLNTMSKGLNELGPKLKVPDDVKVTGDDLFEKFMDKINESKEPVEAWQKSMEPVANELDKYIHDLDRTEEPHKSVFNMTEDIREIIAKYMAYYDLAKQIVEMAAELQAEKKKKN